MYPELYTNNDWATDYTMMWHSVLRDCISCKVTEERNGPFELEMVVPVGIDHYNDIVNGKIITAIPYDGATATAFEIYRVGRPMNGKVKVNARHVTHRMRYCMVRPGTVPINANINRYISGEYYGTTNSLLANETIYKVSMPSSAITKAYTISKPHTLRELLQGSAGSIIQTFGGEWEWKTDGAYWHASRGTTRATAIRYGANLIDLKQEEAIENTYNAAYPFWASEETVVTGEVKMWNNIHYQNPRVMLLDLSSEFETAPTVTQLNNRCQTYVNANCRGVPNVSLTVRFAPLWQALGYEDTELEHIQLCDEVPVIFEQLGVQTTAKVIKTDYNVLTERYNSIELGSERLTAAKAISRLSKATGVSLYT